MTDDKPRIAIEKCGTYRARVQIRRGDGFLPREDCEALDGREIKVEALWVIGGENALYEGEWAMGSAALDEFGRWWIASGDLVLLEKVPSKLRSI